MPPLGLPLNRPPSDIESVRDSMSMSGKRAAMSRLLDDESPVVRQAVLEEIADWKDEGLLFLNDQVKGGGTSATAAKQLLAELGWDDGVDAFRNFIRSFSYELESGFLLLDKVIRPSSCPNETRCVLDCLATRCEELTISHHSPTERCKTISRVLFHEENFQGARTDFHNPLNSSLNFTLESRKGLPLTLCVIYLLVARRIGLKLEPVCFPGRFMLGCFLLDHPFYIDAFDRGRIRNPSEVASFLHSRDLHFSPQAFFPVTIADVLRRACRNLVDHHERSGNQESVRLFSSFGDEFDQAYRNASGQ